MLHVFTVHSPLTFLVSYSVIEHLGIPDEKVLLISSNYTVPTNRFQVIPSYHHLETSILYKITHLNVPKAYSNYIDKVTNDEKFVAYIDLMSYYQRLLITHRNCTQFHFMEEGTSSFIAEDDMTDLTWHERKMPWVNNSILSKFSIISFFRVIRGFNLRILSIPYHYLAYSFFTNIKFYSFSKNAFYNVPDDKRIILKPTISKDLFQMAKNLVLENAIIWLDGASEKYTNLSNSYYDKAIRLAVEKIKEKGWNEKSIYIKLRPGLQNISENSLYKILIENGLNVTVLPDLVVEALYITSKNCKVIGVLSSSLEYAHVFGHEAYSIYTLFEKQPPTFFDRMPGFLANLKSLES